MNERFLTCIICPRGCSLRVELGEGGEPLKVEGNACPRGVDYAVSECTAPMRTVTTTARCKSGAVIAVKTDRAIPKGKVFEAMAEIAALRPEGTEEIGEVIAERIAGTEASVVITGRSYT